MSSEELVALSATLLEWAGVATIVGGMAVASVVAVVDGARTRDVSTWYRSLRRRMAWILGLGLEVLVGADIVRTVGEPTLDNVLILALIVAIRTFLSIALAVELEGHWPWHASARRADG